MRGRARELHATNLPALPHPPAPRMPVSAVVAKLWAKAGLQRQMRAIMLACMSAGAAQFQRGAGYFDLLGFDLLLDQGLNCHLLEVNTDPVTPCKHPSNF